MNDSRQSNSSDKYSKGSYSKNLFYVRKKESINIARYQFKLILLGDIAVGKTSTLVSFTEKKFKEEYFCTVGVEFKITTLNLNDYEKADLQIWDTCGEERFRTITRQYYLNCNGILLFFDVTNYKSFSNLNSWLEDIKKFAPPNVSVFVIGNKSDLVDERVVSTEEAHTAMEKLGLEYCEISAKSYLQVTDLFENLAKKLIGMQERESLKGRKYVDKSNVTSNKVKIGGESMASKDKKSKCC